MNKNICTLIHQCTGTPITFCYGEEAYKKYLEKKYKTKEDLLTDAQTTILIRDNKLSIVIVICDNKIINIYEQKALIVHELNHAVTELMDHFSFNCDEFRSYTLQWLYLEFMPFFDKLLTKES